MNQTSRRNPVRSVAAWICLVLAFVITVPAVLAFWGNRTLMDTENYVATVADLSEDPDVQATVARKVAAAVGRTLDVEALVARRVGNIASARAERVEARLRRTLPAVVQAAAADVVASDEFARYWVDVNRSIQTSLVAALSSQQEGSVQLSEGRLVLDTSQIVASVREELATRGLAEAGDGAARSQQIVLMDAHEVTAARSAYRLASPLSSWLLVIAAVLYLGAILLARRRNVMIVMTAVAVAVCGAALLLTVFSGQDAVRQRFDDPQSADAAQDFSTALVASLRVAAYAMVAAGVLVAAAVPVISRFRRDEPSDAALEEPVVPAGTE